MRLRIALALVAAVLAAWPAAATATAAGETPAGAIVTGDFGFCDGGCPVLGTGDG